MEVKLFSIFIGLLLQRPVQTAVKKTDMTLVPGQVYHFVNPVFTDATKTSYALWKFKTSDSNNIKINCTIEHEMVCGYDELLISTNGDNKLLGANTYCDLSQPVTQMSNGHHLSVGVISSPQKPAYMKKFSCTAQTEPIPKKACECGGNGNPNALLFFHYATQDIQRVFCQGTIIHRRYVLTTALCVEDFEQDPEKINVFIGDAASIADLKTYFRRQTFVAIEVMIHDNYIAQMNDYVGVQSNNAYNIALLKLSKEINFNVRDAMNADMACLPYKYPLNLNEYSQTAFIHTFPYLEGHQIMGFDIMPQYQCDFKDGHKDWDICVSPTIPRISAEGYRQMLAGGGLIFKDRRSYIKGLNVHYGFSEEYSPVSMLEINQFIGWIEERTEVEFCKA